VTVEMQIARRSAGARNAELQGRLENAAMGAYDVPDIRMIYHRPGSGPDHSATEQRQSNQIEQH